MTLRNLITVSLTSLALTSLLASSAFAGPGHSHGHSHEHGHSHSTTKPKSLGSKELISLASKHVIAMVSIKHSIEKAPLASSWTKIPDTQKSIAKKGADYSIVKFEDSAAKKSLFILVSETGELYDANFTGEFKGLKE